MNTLADIEVVALARAVRFDDERMVISLTDGREISVPIEWYPRLETSA